MLEDQHVTTASTSEVGSVEPGSVSELSPLAQRLDGLATWLYWIAAIVLVCAFLAAVIVISTNADTFGLVSPQVETQSRTAIAVALIGGGFAGAGIVAGLGGILKALVRRREL
jgi:hypothetical protein